MKNVLLLVCSLFGLFSCEPKKDPAPAPILGKSFVEIETPNSNLFIGDSLSIIANFTNEKNEVTKPTFIWSSTKSEVATISQKGVLKAFKVGQTFIIAESSSLRDTLIITVLSKESQTIAGSNTTTSGSNGSTVSGTNTTTSGTNGSTVSGANITVSTVIIIAQTATMQLNVTQQLQVQVYNSDSDLLTGKSTSWTSSDNSILEVSSSGLVIAKKAGTATITASSEGVNSLAYSITVSNTMRSGTFVGVGHSCSGSASMKYNAGGNLVVEFGTDFNVQAGPDLYVYLSNTSSGSSINTDGLQLALIGTNSGARTYTTPSGTDISTYKYVVIQCKQYAVTFGYAELK